MYEVVNYRDGYVEVGQTLFSLRPEDVYLYTV